MKNKQMFENEMNENIGTSAELAKAFYKHQSRVPNKIKLNLKIIR